MSMWDDPSFTSIYDNFGTSVESPFDSNRLFDISAAGAADSPTNFLVKNTYEDDTARPNHQSQQFHSRSLVSSRSAESSSQDSASETSTRKRQNTSATSESPPANHFAVKREYDGHQSNNTATDGNPNTAQIQSFGRSMHNLSLEPDFGNPGQSNHMTANFDFGSAASSPGGGSMDLSDASYTAQIQAQMKRRSNLQGHAHHDPPVSFHRSAFGGSLHVASNTIVQFMFRFRLVTRIPRWAPSSPSSSSLAPPPLLQPQSKLRGPTTHHQALSSPIPHHRQGVKTSSTIIKCGIAMVKTQHGTTTTRMRLLRQVAPSA